MDATTFSLLSAAWGLASAIGVAIIGWMSLAGGKSRPRGALAFGLFGIVWGLQIVIGNVVRVTTDPTLGRILFLLLLVGLIPLPYFLVEFAASQSSGSHTRRAWTVARAATALLSGASALLLIFQPDLLFVGMTNLGDRLLAQWGPLYFPLIQAPLFVAFGVALLALSRSLMGAATARLAGRAATLVAGLGIYVAFSAGNNLAFYGGLMAAGAAGTAPYFVALFTLITLVVLHVGLSAVREARGRALPEERRRFWLVAAAILLPLAWGAIEGWLALERLPQLETVGLWRLAGVAVIAYGIARWRFYDLPQRASALAVNASGTVAAGAAGALAYGAGSAVATTSTVPIVAGFLVLAAMYLPSVRFARKLFRVEERQAALANDESLYGQRIDAYRAALEASIARGTVEEDSDFLAALRERFNISEAEERVLLHYARSSVVVFRDRKAWEAYERLRLLGEGGGGRTWLARDRSRDRLVVLKEPLERWQQEPAAREAVLREARLAAKVRHPNVVIVEEVVEGNGSPVIVMEYLEGGSLADLLRSRGTLPWREAVHLGIDILRGVEAVHAAGILHRDLKPSNILLDGSGNPKIADFGIAVPQSSNRTVIDGASTQRAGTYLYMAPEVRSGAALGDKRADLYACAVLLHECIYGAPPSAGPIVAGHDVPAALAALLASGLAERPEERPASARAFAEDLARVVRE